MGEQGLRSSSRPTSRRVAAAGVLLRSVGAVVAGIARAGLETAEFLVADGHPDRDLDISRTDGFGLRLALPRLGRLSTGAPDMQVAFGSVHRHRLFGGAAPDPSMTRRPLRV